MNPTVALRVPRRGIDASLADGFARAVQEESRHSHLNDQFTRIDRSSPTLSFQPALIPDDLGDRGHFSEDFWALPLQGVNSEATDDSVNEGIPAHFGSGFRAPLSEADSDERGFHSLSGKSARQERRPCVTFSIIPVFRSMENNQSRESSSGTGAEPESKPSLLSSDLETLRVGSSGRAMSIDELQGALKGRGVAMLLLLLALPFCFIPVPGLSTPFGIAVVLIGIRIAFRQKHWWPKLIGKRSISAARLEKLLRGGIRFAKIMEKLVKPRMCYLHCWPGAMTLIGLGIAAGGLLLLLPLPIPFSNMVPAWAVVFLTAGMMERDGLVVLLGHALTLLSWGLIAAAWFFGMEGIRRVFAIS